MNIYFSLSIDQYPPYGINQLTETAEIHEDDPSDIAEKIIKELKNNDISTNVTLYPKVIKKIIEELRSEVAEEINKQLSAKREENFFLCKSLEEFKG